MSVLSLFATKRQPSFSLPDFLASWPDAPKFLGSRKKDKLNINQWLDAIAAGCAERGAPAARWPEIARALLGPKALERLEEFERVLVTMQGKQVSWTWERFKVAMASMGWDISRKRTRAFTVAAKKCGLWWIVGKKDDSASPLAPASSNDSNGERPQPKRRGSIFVMRSMTSALTLNGEKGGKTSEEWESVDTPPGEVSNDGPPKRKTPVRAMSDTFTTLVNKALPSVPSDANSESKGSNNEKALVSDKQDKPLKPPTTRAQTEPVSTTVTHAPDWLLGAAGALEHLTSEYPRTMTTLSAILVAAGSVPALAASGGAAALPLLAGTHGGQAAVAFLAGPTAQAVGALAVGLGQWLKAQGEGQVTVTPAPAQIKAA